MHSVVLLTELNISSKNDVKYIQLPLYKWSANMHILEYKMCVKNKVYSDSTLLLKWK